MLAKWSSVHLRTKSLWVRIRVSFSSNICTCLSNLSMLDDTQTTRSILGGMQASSLSAIFVIAFTIIVSSKWTNLGGMVIPTLGALKRRTNALFCWQCRMNITKATSCWDV